MASLSSLTAAQPAADLERVEHDNLPALHSLVNGLRWDRDAVIAGLSSPWSSGQVEGQNTRVKRIKPAQALTAAERFAWRVSAQPDERPTWRG